MDILLPVIAVQIFVEVLGLTVLAKISLHVTIGVLIRLRLLYINKSGSTIRHKFQTYCHISISLFMSAHICLSLNEILLALPIT